MGLLTFSLNVTLDGCVDHRVGIADDEPHAFFTQLMDDFVRAAYALFRQEPAVRALPPASPCR
jgi:hypothetical protein